MAALLMPNEILSLSAQAARRLVASGSGDCALLYLALLESGGDEGKARAALKWNELRLADAFAHLERLKLARRTDATAMPRRRTTPARTSPPLWSGRGPLPGSTGRWRTAWVRP